METTRVAIIGAGITGLAAAYWLEHDHGIDDLVVLESGEEPGGKIWTTIDDGYCLESGPQGFLDNAPDTLELCRAVGLDGVSGAGRRRLGGTVHPPRRGPPGGTDIAGGLSHLGCASAARTPPRARRAVCPTSAGR